MIGDWRGAREHITGCKGGNGGGVRAGKDASFAILSLPCQICRRSADVGSTSSRARLDALCASAYVPCLAPTAAASREEPKAQAPGNWKLSSDHSRLNVSNRWLAGGRGRDQLEPREDERVSPPAFREGEGFWGSPLIGS